MAKLSIRTQTPEVASLVVVGNFCNWDVTRAKTLERKQGAKYITWVGMPKGEYRVLTCKSYIGGEIYPTDGRQMANRYFGGEVDEIISVYF